MLELKEAVISRLGLIIMAISGTEEMKNGSSRGGIGETIRREREGSQESLDICLLWDIEFMFV